MIASIGLECTVFYVQDNIDISYVQEDLSGQVDDELLSLFTLHVISLTCNNGIKLIKLRCKRIYIVNNW